MPFGDNTPIRYVSRRSICDSCIRKDCPDRNFKTKCRFFQPVAFVYVKCEYCNKYFEIHEAMKSDRLTICPDCQYKLDVIRYGRRYVERREEEQL